MEIRTSIKFTTVTREVFSEFIKKYKAKASIRFVKGEIIYKILLHNDLAICCVFFGEDSKVL